MQPMPLRTRVWVMSATRNLQKLLEALDRQPRVDHDPTHRVCVDCARSRDREDPAPVGHHDVFSLANHAKPSPLQRTDCALLRDSGDAGHSDCNVDLANVGPLELLVDHA